PPRNVRLKAFVESGEGSAVILLCAVESNPPAELALLKGGQPVASSRPPAGGAPPGPRGRVSPSPNALRLELRGASEEDEGEYECRASSPLGSARTSLPLRVRGEPAGGKRGWGRPQPSRGRSAVGENAVLFTADAPQEPSFISLVEPRRGRHALLICTVDSFPPSDITLHRGSGRAPLASTWGPAHPRLTVQATPNSLRVEMGGLEPGDAGVYICSANNSYGAASSSLHLDVGGVTVTVEPSPEIPEGTTATMTCSAAPWVGKKTTYTWYKNGQWLREGLANSFILAPVSSTDTGSYCCRASGMGGNATSAPLSLHVLCECPCPCRNRDTTRRGDPGQAGHSSPPPPSPLPADPPRDVSVSTFLENRSGRVGIVLCVADSHPASTIVLYRRGQLLASSLALGTPPGIRISPSHNSLRVELGAVGPEDSGEYVCVAGNPLGNATASTYFDTRTLTHLLAFTIVAGLLTAVICVAILTLLVLKLWPRIRTFWGWSDPKDTFELRSKQEQPQVGTMV
ncbi:SN protein, partial [Trogon melanurus]|nr:SN protein [Trogon melanurus]